jgi:hypothetical protein
MVPFAAAPNPAPSPTNLIPPMRASLRAKLARLLSRPIIGDIQHLPIGAPIPDAPLAFRLLSAASDNPGPYRVRIAIDYEVRWRGREKEIIDTMKGAVEEAVCFLTREQKARLEKTPLEFLREHPGPLTSELLDYTTDNVGGSERVVELVLAAPPESRIGLAHVALLPNIVQIERQLDALEVLERATDDGPLAPLRAFVGLCGASQLPSADPTREPTRSDGPTGDRLDEYQLACVRNAMATPHFAVIQGPPGSGKTTVIKSIVRRSLERGERVIIVSPTHVAVDNVVEKLGPPLDDAADTLIDRSSLPVRYAAHASRLSAGARHYWVGGRGQQRKHTIAHRLRQRLCATLPLAADLFEFEDNRARECGPLTAALDGVEDVICGTPIGVLSCRSVKTAVPGAFDLLIVDEVSKMTLPEFLAIAVKARRWVLVGDPEQLPPHCDCEDNGVTLDEVLDPGLELACSAADLSCAATSIIANHERMLVVARDPTCVAAAIRGQIGSVALERRRPSVAVFDQARGGPLATEIVVCGPDDAEAAIGDRGTRTRILVERNLDLPGVDASRVRSVEPKERASARIFATTFEDYHKQPWATRSGPGSLPEPERAPCVPSVDAVAALADPTTTPPGRSHYRCTIDALAERIAVNMLSVYDWLTGPPDAFAVTPLRELRALRRTELCRVVRPFASTLEKQYRMHSTLSRVPRELFYFGEALHDGKPDDHPGCRVALVQVSGDGGPGESNQREVDEICRRVEALAGASNVHVMIITPYRKQEALLREAVEQLKATAVMSTIDIEVCTLDRCQGREAEYVFISLVGRRASRFLDMPKRWNVALTRAKEGVFLVGDLDAYRAEARRRSVDRYGPPRPVSVIARVIDAYDLQIATYAGGAR